MATRIESAPDTPDPSRITALAVSFLTHAAAALILAIPLAATLEHTTPRVIEASVLEPPPPRAPMPPEPEPVQRVRPQVVAPPQPRPVPVRPVAPVAQQPAAVVPVETSPIAATDPAPDATDMGTLDSTGAGESRVLAYDGALKLDYPRAAIRRHAQGTVLLHVLVGADGVAQQVELSRSSGHRDLDDAAREAVRKARFRPVLENGVAVPAWGLVPIEFSLSRG